MPAPASPPWAADSWGADAWAANTWGATDAAAASGHMLLLGVGSVAWWLFVVGWR